MAPSSARNKGRVLWIAVHTMEGITDADDAAAFFHRSTNSSAHAVADDQKLIEGVVPYDRAAWTLRGGNPISDNLELCAFADMSRTQWLSRENVTFYAPSLKRMVTARRPYYQLVHAANWIRSRCQVRGIAMTKIGPAEVAVGNSGVIGHVDYTKGKLDGTHWDPGPGFPWDVVMQLVGGALPEEDEDMGPQMTEFQPSGAVQYHRWTTECGGESLVVGRAWFALSSGYHPVTGCTIWFTNDSGVIVETNTFAELGENKRWVKELPNGCTGVTAQWSCSGPVSAGPIYGKK